MTLLEQRIRARDWANVAKMEGRSIDAVRMSYAPSVERAPAEPAPVKQSDLAKIQARMKALRWNHTHLADAACSNRDYVACILRGTVDLTAAMRDRLTLAPDIAEDQQRDRAA